MRHWNRIFVGVTILIGAGAATMLWLLYAGHRRLPWVLALIVLAGRGLGEAQQ